MRGRPSTTRVVWACAIALAQCAAAAAPAAAVELDLSFGDAGKLLIADSPEAASGTDVVEPADGGLLMAGEGQTEAGVLKRRDDGTPDPDFGDQGRATIPLPEFADPLGTRLALQPDGRIVTATGIIDPTLPSSNVVVLTRLLSTGALDPSFGDGGVVRTVIGPPGIHFGGVDMALTLDGRIVVSAPAGGGLAVARFLADGGLDASFSDDGQESIPVRGGGQASAVAALPDGRIVVAGRSKGVFRQRRAALVRLLSDGSLDRSFAGDGIFTARLGQRGAATIDEIALAPRGRLVAVGERAIRATNSEGVAHLKSGAFVVRLEPGGARDRAFSRDGVWKSELAESRSQRVELHTVLAPPNGKVLAAGSLEKGFLLARLRADGRRDRSFAESGLLTTSFGIGRAGVSALALRAGGTITAVGARTITSGGGRTFTSDLAAARYRP